VLAASPMHPHCLHRISPPRTYSLTFPPSTSLPVIVKQPTARTLAFNLFIFPQCGVFRTRAAKLKDEEIALVYPFEKGALDPVRAYCF
jgi:hypothetical protein